MLVYFFVFLIFLCYFGHGRGCVFPFCGFRLKGAGCFLFGDSLSFLIVFVFLMWGGV